jgi:tetratricopeptide (TPR) repeat protein
MTSFSSAPAGVLRRALSGLAIAAALLHPPLAQAQDEVVFRDPSGRVVTRQALAGATGRVDWATVYGRNATPSAVQLHDLGRRASQQGNNDQAFDYFLRAAKAAPDWPYPLYDAAYSQLLQRRYAKALELYVQADQLAPRGFLTVKTAVHALRQERDGKIPEGTYLAYLGREWLEPEKLPAMTQALVERAPAFAPGWKALAQMERNLDKRFVLLEKGLAANPDVQTRGLLLLDKAFSLEQQGKIAEAKAILGALVLDPTTTLDVEALAKFTLADIVDRTPR